MLADSFASDSDCINNLQFILGTKSSFCLKSSDVSFGPKNDSIYSECEIGAILVGDLDDLFKNICHLPEREGVGAYGAVTKRISSDCVLN